VCGVDWRESLPEDEARKEEAAAILMTFPSELRTFAHYSFIMTFPIELPTFLVSCTLS
jgi:hypothetical protein